MASPLHAAYPPESKHTRNLPNTSYDHGDASLPSLHPDSSVASGRASSPSKQTRRLQLRNAGFRGGKLPTRETTPKSQPSSSTNWSSVSGLQQSSDAENVSPLSGKRTDTTAIAFGLSSNVGDSSGGILQDIGNANAVNFRPGPSKRARTSATSGKFWSGVQNDSALSNLNPDGQDDSQVPLQPASTLRPRSVRVSRTKASRSRRSISGETRKYVDHLELQLSEAQSQLSAMTSPTVTREQSSKMRHLNAETKQLQGEVADWEAKYDERVHEEMDKHYQVEATLRTRIRSLEDEAETTKYRVQDLETELEMTKQSTEAVEAANVQLEKRLEIMSELLAASPTRIDLHAPIPGRRRQSRPHSMLPRFPTAGSFASSPERVRAHAASPSSSSCRFSPMIPLSPSNLTFSPEVASDDDESSNSDLNSVIVAPPTAKKPMRRMRRFGAGSIGPKPLILPSTSHCDQIPASAPPFDRDEPECAFPFSSRFHTTHEETGTRCRASSDANPASLVRPSPSPLANPESLNDGKGLLNDTLGVGSSPSRLSLVTTNRDVSSGASGFGAVLGRNLMEELTAVRSNDSMSETEQTTETQIHIPADDVPNSSPFNSDAVDDRPTSLPGISSEKEITPPEALTARFASGSSTAVASSTAYGTLRLPEPPEMRSLPSSMSLGMRSNTSISTLDSLRTIFSNLLRSPVELAKHLVQTAQSRMSIPRPLLTVQWWLVGVLLGPMARRRMLGKSKPCCKDSGADQRSLWDADSSAADESIAYGTAYQTPQSSPSHRQVRSLVAGIGKKRTPSPFSDSRGVASPCPHHPSRFKHHPWLWLKFSMTLALAVGVAFKDGPSSLLKDTACQCKKSGRRLSVRSGSGCANWRKARRDRILSTPESTEVGGADGEVKGPRGVD